MTNTPALDTVLQLTFRSSTGISLLSILEVHNGFDAIHSDRNNLIPEAQIANNQNITLNVLNAPIPPGKKDYFQLNIEKLGFYYHIL